ncbi:transposase [Actinomadura harenae]|uniref:transposase n=1 Tax=Actinomadura harenae TaxID=2483351 RepID=UPI002277644D
MRDGRHHLQRPGQPGQSRGLWSSDRSHGGSGYPLVRLVAVVACGTRTLLGATFGRFATGETTYAPELLDCLKAGMLMLGDRNFAVKALVTAIAGPQGTGADLLIRCKSTRPLPRLETLADRSWRSVLGGVPIRVIDAQITVTLPSGGRRTGHYRLITTLLDPRLHPAREIVKLYHQRWEIETAYLELKSTTLGGRVLRSRTPQGTDQEIYALLAAYQALRLAMADATTTGAVPADRASFTIALLAARDQVIHAAGIITHTPVDLIGQIGRAVLDHPLPARRDRSCPRIVKRAISKHRAKGQIDRTNHQTTTTINILPEPDLTPAQAP